MGTTLAQLGIEIKTNGVNESKNALDSLTVSAKKAQDATTALNKTSEDSVKANKNAQLSYEMMISKLTESGAVYNARQMQIKGYTNDQIALIDKLTKKNNDHVEALKLNAQVEKQILSQKEENYKKYINDVSDGNAHLLRMEKQRLDQETFAAKASYNSRKLMYENLFNQPQPTSLTLTQGMSSAGRLANNPSQQMVIGMSASGLNAQAKAAQDAKKAADDLSNSHQSLLSRTLNLNGAIGNLVAGFSAIAIYQTTKDVIMLADKMTLLDARVKIATKSAEDYRAVNAALTKISLSTGSSLESNITLFSRLNKSVESVGGSYRNTLGLVELLNKGLKISGASTSESASVVIQLSQALSKGKLNGDEFRSVMENGSRIVDALTTALGKTKGELQEMASQGKLTSTVVINALQSQANAIDKDFAKMPLTIGMALENINTSFSRYVQQINESAGATNRLAQALDLLAQNMKPILDTLIMVGEMVAFVFASKMITSIAKYINNIKLAAAATQTAALTMSASIAAVMSPVALLNVALVGLAGWEVGKWLNNFKLVREIANDALYGVMTAIENTTYYWERFQIAISRDSKDQKWAQLDSLKKAHEAATKSIEDLISADNTYVNGASNAAQATGTQKQALEMLTEQSEMSEKESQKAAKAFNSSIESQIKDIQRLNTAKLASFELEREENDAAFQRLQISSNTRYQVEVDLIHKIRDVKLKALDEEEALQRSKVTRQVDNVSTAYQAILAIETNGKNGQVNKSSMAMGAGQVLPSTLVNPGYGVKPFQPAIDENLVAMGHNYEKVKAFATAHDAELKIFGETYFKALVKSKGSVAEALKIYGEDNEAYRNKFKKAYADISGETIKQNELDDKAKDIANEKNKIIAEALKAETKARNEQIKQSQEYVKNLEYEKLKYYELSGAKKQANDLRFELDKKYNTGYQYAKNIGDTEGMKIYENSFQAQKDKPYLDIHEANQETIKSGEIQSKFNDRIAETRKRLDEGQISLSQFNDEMFDLGKNYNDNFIEPASESTKQLSEFGIQAARNMESAFADFLFDPFKDGLMGMADNFALMLRRMAADALAAQLSDAMFGKKSGSGGSNTGGLLSAGISALGMFGGGSSSTSGFQGNGMLLSYANAHTGGIIGQTTGTTIANSSVFDSAMRYHTGGIAGLKPNEVPAILLRNEEVLTEDNPRHINNVQPNSQNQQTSSPNNYNITVQVSNGTPSEVRRSAAQGARQALSMVSGAKRYE